jgi:hypothetical protein
VDTNQDQEWTDDRIIELETRLLQGIFGSRSTEAVEAGITYAKYLSTVGITPENCPVFLRMLEIENHWVIDALIGDRDPFLLLSPVQPNRHILQRVFAMLTRWPKGRIYSKSLSVILGVLQSVYSSPKEGYRIYPLRIADLNALGKHLDKGAGQDEPRNRVILEVLDKISELDSESKRDVDEIAIHSAAIRNAFFDERKKMEDVIPPVLLVGIEGIGEVKPRKRSVVGGDESGGDGGSASSEAPKAPAKKSSSKKS